MKKAIERFLYRNGQKRNSPSWAVLEGFKVPDIKDPDITYLARIRLVQTPWFGVYVHRISLPDARDVLHDHPWPFVSFLLRGSYTEMTPGPGASSAESTAPYALPRRVRFVNVKRFNKSYHWISEVHRDPVWTLVFVGRRRRVWGYLEPDGKRYDFDKHPINDEFVAALADRGGGDLM